MRNKAGLICLLCIFSLVVSGCSRIPGKLLIMEGNFFNAREAYSKAISSYLKALEHSEAAPYAEYGLGSAYLALGEEKAALARFAEAGASLDSFPSAVNRELRYRIHYNTGVILFIEGDFSGARDSFREALKTDGGKKEAKRNLELSIRSHERENASGGGRNDNESMNALFEYIRLKEQNQWKSREWQKEENTNGPDY